MEVTDAPIDTTILPSWLLAHQPKATLFTFDMEKPIRGCIVKTAEEPIRFKFEYRIGTRQKKHQHDLPAGASLLELLSTSQLMERHVQDKTIMEPRQNDSKNVKVEELSPTTYKRHYHREHMIDRRNHQKDANSDNRCFNLSTDKHYPQTTTPRNRSIRLSVNTKVASNRTIITTPFSTSTQSTCFETDETKKSTLKETVSLRQSTPDYSKSNLPASHLITPSSVSELSASLSSNPTETPAKNPKYSLTPVSSASSKQNQFFSVLLQNESDEDFHLTNAERYVNNMSDDVAESHDEVGERYGDDNQWEDMDEPSVTTNTISKKTINHYLTEMKKVMNRYRDKQRRSELCRIVCEKLLGISAFDQIIVDNIKAYLNQESIKGKSNLYTQHAKDAIWCAMSGEEISPWQLSHRLGYSNVTSAERGAYHRRRHFRFDKLRLYNMRKDCVRQPAAEAIYNYLHDVDVTK